MSKPHPIAVEARQLADALTTNDWVEVETLEDFSRRAHDAAATVPEDQQEEYQAAFTALVEAAEDHRARIHWQLSKLPTSRRALRAYRHIKSKKVRMTRRA